MKNEFIGNTDLSEILESELKEIPGFLRYNRDYRESLKDEIRREVLTAYKFKEKFKKYFTSIYYRIGLIELEDIEDNLIRFSIYSRIIDRIVF